REYRPARSCKTVRSGKSCRRSPDGARVSVRSVAWVSPSGPVTQDRTARRLRAVVDVEDGAHHLASARIASGRSVRITYDGGTRGISPRSITPRRFQQKGGRGVRGGILPPGLSGEIVSVGS